jgi:hypothetical protein
MSRRGTKGSAGTMVAAPAATTVAASTPANTANGSIAGVASIAAAVAPSSSAPVATSIGAAAPAKGPESPIHQLANQHKTFSTPKGRKSKAEAIGKKVTPGWHIRSVLVDGGLEVIFITTANFVDDGYGIAEIANFFKKSKEDTDLKDPILQIGLLGQYFMRVSLENPDRLTEKKGTYQRKCLVRVLDPGEETTEARYAALQTLKKFLEDKKHNTFNTAVHLNFSSFDITPSILPKLDHYVQFSDIVKIITDIFDNVNSNWAANNMESALVYLTQGYIPIEACQELGFPIEYVMNKPGSVEN